MSRVAKNPVFIPAGLTITINGQVIKINGSSGSLDYRAHDLVKIIHSDNQLTVAARNNSSLSDALAGSTRALINNMVVGLTQGFVRKLELVGVGYRAQLQGKIINLTLGFSHPVVYDIPPGIIIETPSQIEIVIKGNDKRLVGQVAADIRRYRPPEPYKGKGIRYAGERIELKETKKK